MVINDNMSINNISEISSSKQILQRELTTSKNIAQEAARDQYIPTLISVDNQAIPSSNYNASGVMEDDFSVVAALVTDNKTGMDSAYMNIMTGEQDLENSVSAREKESGEQDLSGSFGEEMVRELNIL